MSDQNNYNQHPGSFQSNNPWADSQGNTPSYVSAPPQQQQQYQQQQYQQQQPQQQYGGYTPPPGPPPGQQGQPGLPPRRAGTFEESDFVPAGERGEQREAMEQFEMSKGAENQTDRDVAQLQREFPGVEGSLIAAIYSDGGMGQARETLQELASQMQGGQGS